MAVARPLRLIFWSVGPLAGLAWGQVPVLQDEARLWRASMVQQAIGREAIPPAPRLPSLEGGMFLADRGAAWMPLIGSEGLGTALQGSGVMVRGAYQGEHWFAEGTFVGFRPMGQVEETRGRLQSFEVGWTSGPGRWRLSLHQKSLNWGEGLNGGYLMGPNSLPFPKLMIVTPAGDLSLFGVPLGNWQAEFFVGRLEWNREIPEWMSNPVTTGHLLQAQGDLRRPDLSGLRLKAAFGEHVDMSFGLASMWGGVMQDGTRVMAGSTGLDYLIASLGAENLVIAERSGDADEQDPGDRYVPSSAYKGYSNGIACIDLGIRIPPLARLLGASGARFYLSRGAENVNWQWEDFLKDPFGAWGHDLTFINKKLRNVDLFGGDPESLWGYAYAEGTPTLTHVNDCVGLILAFPTWDLGIELMDTHNQVYPGSTFRTYSHWRFLSGHSRMGDSLGQAFGGEVYLVGLDLGFHLGKDVEVRVRFRDGIRFYRDQELGPEAQGSDDPFQYGQTSLQWQHGRFRFGADLAVERHNAFGFIAGQHRTNWTATFGMAARLP